MQIKRQGFSRRRGANVVIEEALRVGHPSCWVERRMGRPGAGATPASGDCVKPLYHYSPLAELADAVEAGM
jgi:hypothetical protein